MIAKCFKAAFQPTIGIVQRFEASWIARYTSFNAESALGYCFRFLEPPLTPGRHFGIEPP